MEGGLALAREWGHAMWKRWKRGVLGRLKPLDPCDWTVQIEIYRAILGEAVPGLGEIRGDGPYSTLHIDERSRCAASGGMHAPYSASIS
jgi:hypothetical protein